MSDTATEATIFQQNGSNNAFLLEKLAPYAPRQTGGRYIKFQCPSCGKPDAYCYTAAGVFSVLQCSHKNSCGWTTKAHDFFELDVSTETEKHQKQQTRKYFESHGLDLSRLQAAGIVDNAGTMILGVSGGKRYEMKLKYLKSMGKLKYITTRGFNKKMAELYPVLHEGDILYIFAGETDWMKGVMDGLACTSSLFGEKCKPTEEQGIALLSRFSDIRLVYDTDETGKKWAPRVGLHIKEKFPDTKVSTITLQFDEHEAGKDYCDYRLNHSLEDFLSLPTKEINPQKTRQELKKEKELERMRERLEAAGEKPFTKEIKRFQSNKKDKNFLITDKGIYIEQITEQLGFQVIEWKKVCSDNVEIINIMEDICSEESYITLSWDRCGIKKTKIVPSSLLWSKNLDKLTGATGLRILNGNAADVCDYFLASLDHAKPELFSTRNGWISGNFIAGTNLISDKGTSEIKRREDDIKLGATGSRAAWIEIIKPFVELDPQAQIACGVSTISCMLKLLSVSSFTLHLFGQSSTGKTLAAQIAASFWGDYATLIQDWKGSTVAHEIYFDQMQHLPCFLDECQENKANVVKSTIYQFGNNRGKPRGTREAALRKGKDWQTTLISTGETRVTDSSIAGGLAARVIELHKRLYNKIDNEIEFVKFFQKIEQNHGHAGPEIIRYSQKNKKAILDRYIFLLEKLQNDCQQSEIIICNVQKRLLKPWAAILLGCELNQVIFGLEYNQEAVFRELRQSMYSMETAKTEENIYEAIIELYTSHERFFHHKTTGGITGSNESISWGIEDRTRGIVYFYSNQLKIQLEKIGYSWSMLSYLKDTGNLLYDSDGKRLQTKSPRFQGQRVRSIAIKLPKETE